MRYATWAILGDYFRAVGGFGVALMLLIVLPPNPWLLGLFGLVCALFVWFFYQTLLRHCSQVDIHEEGLAVTGLINRRIAWDDLSALSLRYYGTAREIKKGEGGHMQLRLTGRNGRRYSFDSGLEGFETLVKRAALEARKRGVWIDNISADCMLTLGIEIPAGTEDAGGGQGAS